MPLSAAQQQTFQNWLSRKNPNFKCPCCGQNNFQTGEIIAPPTLVNGAINMGGNTIPMLTLICSNCAHVSLFATIPIGI
jgi:predicted nucleic-acid-binding Zn-ribbon protein